MANDAESEAALGVVQDYAKSAANDEFGDDLARYAKTSAEFSAIGGALGSVVPGVGTALGGLVGAGAGILYEGGGDLIDALFPDGPKRVKESPEKAERAFAAYQALGGERGTKMAYPQWWKVYVAAGRPSSDVLLAARKAESAARKLAKGAGVAPPPPPPPRRTASASGMAGASFATQDDINQGAAKGLVLALPLLGILLWLRKR